MTSLAYFQDDLQYGMALLGENLSEKMLGVMFREADRDRDGMVTYDGKPFVTPCSRCNQILSFLCLFPITHSHWSRPLYLTW